MVSITVETKLLDAHDRLLRVANELDDLGQLERYETKELYRKCVHRRRAVAKFAVKVGLFAKRLAKSSKYIKKLVARDQLPVHMWQDPGCPQPKPLEKFHLFGQLPAELRIMIWQYACQPPPCIDYFRSHFGHERGGPPAASMMADGGLWMACYESQWVIRQVYRRMHSHVLRDGCMEDDVWLDRHYVRLGRFNRSGKVLQRKMRSFHNMFRRQLNGLGYLPPSRISDLYRTYRQGEDDLILGEEMIRWKTLFTQIEI